MIRVLHVGLGPIGAAVAMQIATRKGFRIVGAVDIDSNKIGLERKVESRTVRHVGFTESIQMVDGGIHGDIATASITVNSIPAILAAAPGLPTMRDMRLPSLAGQVK